MGQTLLEYPNVKERNGLTLLVPMPTSWRRAWKRGYNQSEQLAKGIRRRMRLEGVQSDIAPLLEKVEHRRSQIHFGPHERWGNARDAVRARRVGRGGIKKERILPDALLVLVDDTVTTGASLVLAGEQLREAFPKNEILLLALALEQ